jgi:DNA helicase II / ATP-dependent DNA helicase PcrA
VPNAPLFQPPAVEAIDIAWVCGVMGLPSTAFTGADGTDPRLAVLRSMETLDIEACPGSGKTTLLVAKLAILANKWPHQRRGICVLSHTNAARNEIETKLSSCSAGRALLRYPHFVGTIHSFVNEFLAEPWLRSEGYPIKVVDTEIALNVRWSKVPHGTRIFLEKRNLTKYCVSYDRVDFGGGRKGSLGEHTDTYKTLLKICEETSKSGYFCYDEMFVWAGQLLDLCPNILEALRLRFPLLFIDEVQDNSELQSAILHRVFCAGQNPAARQRFGDSNQAIFQNAEQSGATTDPFPGPWKADLPHSFRFGQVIADLANPLGVVPQGLVGLGPLQGQFTVKVRPSALILFDDQTILSVLAEYAKYLLDAFTAEELATGLYTAVSGVHTSEKTDKVPRTLGHYAPSYNPDISRKDSSPESFIQSVLSGRREMADDADAYPIVSKTGAAILRLAQLADADLSYARRKSSHRYVLELLEQKAEVRQSYLSLIDRLIRDGGEISEAQWNDECRPCVAKVAAAIAGKPATASDCTKFLEWMPPPSGIAAAHAPETHDNVYRYPPDAPKVNIRLCSIHSVKGETHTATLVLESYYFAHHLQELKPWLLGMKTGGTKQTVRILGRLKLHYVAMTRPSHLLCLAMRRDSLNGTEIAMLAARGWHIIDCTGANNAPTGPGPA